MKYHILRDDVRATNDTVERDIKLLDETNSRLYQHNEWCYVEQPTVVLPRQGFKIHVSCTVDNYQDVLETVYDYCRTEQIVFKYLCNLKLLKQLLSSLAERSSGGKFITIYPENEAQFVAIMPALHERLIAFDGPKIMSDRRYSLENKVLHYRYGIIQGSKNDYLIDPDGKMYVDKRVPYFELPPFVVDPFPKEVVEAQMIGKEVIATSAIQLKFSGGVYRAEYKKQAVILKEARAYTNKISDVSQIDLKQNEARMLKYLADHQVTTTPGFITAFEEEDNYYLVEEAKPGLPISRWREDNYQKVLEKIPQVKTILTNLVQAVAELHALGVAIGDLSQENILIDGTTIYFIDVEQSYFESEGTQLAFFSNGFYDHRLFQQKAFMRDWMQLAYVVMSLFTKSNFTISLLQQPSLTIFYKEAADSHLPVFIVELVKYLFSSEDKSVSDLLTMIQSKSGDEVFTYTPNQSISINEFYQDIKQSVSKLDEFSVCLSNKTSTNYVNGRLGIYDLLDIQPSTANLEQGLQGNLCDYLSTLMYLYRRQDKDWIARYEGQLSRQSVTHPPEFKGIFDGDAAVALLASQLYRMSYQSIYSHIENRYRNDLAQFWQQEMRTNSYRMCLNDGVLGYLYYLLNSATIAPDETYVTQVLTAVIAQGLVIDKQKIGLRIRKNSSIISPYLYNGHLGLIMTLIAFRNRFDSHVFDDVLQQMAENIYQPCQGGSLLYGSAGFGLVALALYETFGSEQYLDALVSSIKDCIMRVVSVKDELYLLSPTFHRVGADVGFGLSGIMYLLERMRENEKCQKIMEMVISV
ncbi:hypothetical protein IU402_01365 [Aerococcaceae bacterium zg-BR9]|uniref:class III lanthionine synthetase LanKC N-terminal domain-containing protein n=1 Tax=Aerococcaceae bacterium zg-1292 TaxID=2774330 RepID=UPI0040628803|nr:hypothetical protein [Aerococcaceae bacterium zg-BR9]